MIIKGEFADDDRIVSYEITEEQQHRIIARLIDYYSNYLYTGEGIQQDDDSIIEAPSVLSDICDNIIEFKMHEEINEFDTYEIRMMNDNLNRCKECRKIIRPNGGSGFDGSIKKNQINFDEACATDDFCKCNLNYNQ